MKEGWEIKKLGEVCEKIIDGSHNPPKGVSFSEYPMISSQNIEDNCINKKNIRYLTFENFQKENARTRIQTDDVLLSIVGTIGKVYVVKSKDVPLTMQRSIAVLKVKSNIRPHYLKYFFKANIHLLNDEARGVAQKGIYLKQLSSFIIPIPSLSEQTEIVAELDLLNGIIEKKRQQLKELDALSQSIFYSMFGDPVENEMGWETYELKSVAPPKQYTGNVPNNNGKFWLLNLDMIISQTGEIIEKYFVDESEIGNSTIKFNEENVLYSKLRPYLNKVSMPDSPGFATSELIPLHPKADILTREYLTYLLRSQTFVCYIKEKVSGAKMPRVIMDDFKKFPIPIPPLPLQQAFASKIEAIEHQKELIKTSLEETQTLLDSRMDYYFN